MVSKTMLIELLGWPGDWKVLEKQAGVKLGIVRDILAGRVRPRHGDPRVIALGRALGLRLEDCFYRYGADDEDL